jgi:DNA mismatch endonuclease (patch repair protein)
MSRVRDRDTHPEMVIRRGLHARGLRFRVQAPDLPGRPDLVFPKWHAVLLVHGCFWHGHGCHLFRLPATRPDFWATKIAKNKTRDSKDIASLSNLGWRTLTVWECAIRGRSRRPENEVFDYCEAFLKGAVQSLEIKGIDETSV